MDTSSRRERPQKIDANPKFEELAKLSTSQSINNFFASVRQSEFREFFAYFTFRHDQLVKEMNSQSSVPVVIPIKNPWAESKDQYHPSQDECLEILQCYLSMCSLKTSPFLKGDHLKGDRVSAFQFTSTPPKPIAVPLPRENEDEIKKCPSLLSYSFEFKAIALNRRHPTALNDQDKLRGIFPGFEILLQDGAKSFGFRSGTL